MVGKHGTDMPSVFAVQQAVGRLVRKQWGGWSVSDREDLEQVVIVKYFGEFGRDRLPDDPDGQPAVPIGWLVKVIRNAGIDLHRARVARPADPVDFQGPDGFALDRIQQAINPQSSLSSVVARELDVQRILAPAMEALRIGSPMDANLIKWRYIDDRDLADIAKILQKSPDTTKRAVQRAMGRLRDLMSTESANLPD